MSQTNPTITIAGATGNLGGRIAAALTEQGANVRAIVRPGTASDRLDALKKAGVELREGDMSDVSNITRALEGSDCVVSALQGLRDVIVDAQTVLLDAAVAANVPRFIPSDYCSDFTRLAVGENRNFDLRHEFRDRLDKAPIEATSILNGAFAYVLAYGGPIFNFKTKTVGFWDSPDIRVDYTTMDDTAAFTAAAALDTATPRLLKIASFQVSARELAQTASEVLQTPFELVDMGSLQALSAHNHAERAAHPEGETDLYASWQMSQYAYSMFKVGFEALDNARYPQLHWTSLRDVLGALG